ncbi:PREDICTED: interleukin-3 receptor subunit alpha [Ceratotherium simum simum]|uniref:Interleukin-3 receptor subunit alpha n=1 Tax=Ceratotherium simum simum TaxID=73337 RepID=A0ABM1DGS1_CERSS|nr:PREDICTED: interleukin-3 receptor subunit alpha [Ceratotherium simum simum]
MAFLWLAVFLMPVSCLLHTDQDANSPIKNLRMEPRSRRLTWDLNGNVTEIKCVENPNYPIKAKNNRYCEFRALPSCKAKNYTVNVTSGQSFSTSILYPEQEGKPGAAAENLKCWVHDVDFLTCSWTVGREAPSDVQYRLYVEDLKTHEEWQCARYRADERGTHTWCHFDDVSRFSDHFYRFLVNGTSRGSRIPCSEIFEELSEIGSLDFLQGPGETPSRQEAYFKSMSRKLILTCFAHTSVFFPRLERLSPPNVTGWCNKTYALMEWRTSSHFTRRFNYELQIQMGTDPAYTTQVSAPVLPEYGIGKCKLAIFITAHPAAPTCQTLHVLKKNFFVLSNPGTYTVQIRTQSFFTKILSEWSDPKRFVCDPEKEGAGLRVWLTASLTALGTLLALGLLLLLCRRYSVTQKLFPPIPRMKDHITDHLQNKLMVWEAGKASREECPVAEVQVLGET